MSKKLVPYISASQIGTFLTCPIAYRNFYVKGMPKPPPNIYMVYGTAIHKALELNFRQKIKTKKDLNIAMILTEFRLAMAAGTMKVKSGVTNTILRSMELSAQASLGYYMKEIAPSIQPKEVEFKFEIKLKHYPITLMGYIDLITEDDIIIDYKTAGKDWKRKFSPSAVDKNIQMTIYAAIFRKLFKRKEKGLIFDVMPRCESKVFRKETIRTDEQILKVLQVASSIEQIIKLGVFIPNFSNCNSQCQFFKTCEKVPIVDK